MQIKLPKLMGKSPYSDTQSSTPIYVPPINYVQSYHNLCCFFNRFPLQQRYGRATVSLPLPDTQSTNPDTDSIYQSLSVQDMDCTIYAQTDTLKKEPVSVVERDGRLYDVVSETGDLDPQYATIQDV